MKQPIVLTNGQHEVKIYTVQNRGREVFQLSYYEGGKRERQTFAKVSDARKEGKLVLGRLAMNRHDVAELSTAAMESYVVARKHVEPTGLPLHVCAELFAQAHAKLAGRALADAVDFFVSSHPAEMAVKPLADLITDFAEGRRKMGVAADCRCVPTERPVPAFHRATLPSIASASAIARRPASPANNLPWGPRWPPCERCRPCPLSEPRYRQISSW